MLDSRAYKKLVEMEREVSEDLYKKAAIIDPIVVRRIMEEAADQAFEAYRVKQTLDKANKKQTKVIEEEYPSETTYPPIIDPTPIRERLDFLRNRFRQAISPLTEPIDADSFIREKVR
jgi:hypothetical protein